MCIQSSLQTRMCGIKAGTGVEGVGRVRSPGALWPQVRAITANSEESPGFLKKRQLSQTPRLLLGRDYNSTSSSQSRGDSGFLKSESRGGIIAGNFSAQSECLW